MNRAKMIKRAQRYCEYTAFCSADDHIVMAADFALDQLSRAEPNIILDSSWFPSQFNATRITKAWDRWHVDAHDEDDDGVWGIVASTSTKEEAEEVERFIRAVAQHSSPVGELYS